MITAFLDSRLTAEQKELIEWNSNVTQKMLKQLDTSVITQQYGIGLPHISKQNPLLVKNFTWLMAKLGFGKTDITKNFSRFNFNMSLLDQSEILVYRTKAKLDAMGLRHDDTQYSDTLVKRPDGIGNDGLARPGMMMAAKRNFKLDRDMLAKYRRPIIQNIVKSIQKGIEQGHISNKYFVDHASYTEIANLLVDQYIREDREYNSECNIQDQRGRAVKKILKRVGNYISSKDFRALLIVPREHAITMTTASTKELNDIYLFIAELTGNKCLGGTVADKIEAGRQAYLRRELPRLDLKSEHGRKELHELIWLERIYFKLNGLFSRFTTEIVWDIPIEIDHSMSLAQIVGALTNDKRILESTSVTGDTLSDPWFIEGVRRLTAKSVGTPVFYGSSQSAVSLIKAKGIDIDKEEINKLKREFTQGRFAVLKAFKDLLIQNYNVHTPIIDIDTGISQFKIHVNHFKTAGTKTVVTEAYNGAKFKYSFTHESVLVPDYKRMKLFWATCLVHHLDSDLMEHNLMAHPDYWALDIHDAIICLPGHATDFRITAAARLKTYNDNRYTIINKYRESIGAVTPKADVQYMNLLKLVKDAGDVEFKSTLMK